MATGSAAQARVKQIIADCETITGSLARNLRLVAALLAILIGLVVFDIALHLTLLNHTP